MVTHTIRRKLNPAQLERRDRILSATRDIISSAGNDALNMQHVAKKAGVSRVTLYRYYSSRDHLISDMALEWGLSLVERLQNQNPPGYIVGEKITAVFTSIFKEAQQNPNLISATLNTLTSRNYPLVESRIDVEQLLPSLLRTVLDDREIPDARRVLQTLERLVLANLLFLVSRRSALDEAVDNMAYAGRLLYGEQIWNRPAM